MGFPRQAYWSGLPFPPPGDLPDPEIEPACLAFPALAGGFFTSTTWEAKVQSFCSTLVGQEKYSPAGQDLPPVRRSLMALTGTSQELWPMGMMICGGPVTFLFGLSHSGLHTAVVALWQTTIHITLVRAE